MNPPRINEQALPTLESISRFWQFKRKKLATALQAHLLDAQSQLEALFDEYKQALETDIEQLESRKGEFNAFKLDALEIGGTALFDRIDQAFPLTEQMFESSGLERLVDECESLRRKLKLAAQQALA